MKTTYTRLSVLLFLGVQLAACGSDSTDETGTSKIDGSGDGGAQASASSSSSDNPFAGPGTKPTTSSSTGTGPNGSGPSTSPNGGTGGDGTGGDGNTSPDGTGTAPGPMSTASPDNSALCPATAPMRGDSCDPAAGTCNYSTADCTCRMGFGGGGGGGFFGGAAADAGAAPSASTTETGTWNCQAPPRTGECPATLPTDGDTCDVPAQTPCDYDQDTCVCGGGGGFGGGGFGGGGGAVTWNCTGGQQAGGADGGTTPTQPAQTCPDAAPTDGDTCNVSGRLTCTYDTLDCRCPRAGGGGGGGFGGGGGGGTRAWTCNDNTMGPTQPGPAMDAGAAVTPMCPAEAPADGDTCDMPRGSDCAYADVQCSCNGFGGNRTWGCDPTATAMDASIAPPPPPPPADVDAGSADAAP